MNYRHLVFGFLLALGAVALGQSDGGVHGFDARAWLNANASVESGNNPHRVGPRGELGRQQMMRSTVRDYSREVWRMSEPAFAAEIERRHLAWIVAGLARHGYPVDGYHCALVWHAGLTAVLTGRTRPSQRWHAQRVANLYEEARR